MDIPLSASPEPMVRTSSTSSVRLRHPTPDLQSIQGAYIHNVERLERSAERLSLSSDMGEEIRKLHNEQKLSDSRRSSMRIAALEEQEKKNRSRTTSTSSYHNSIVEVNNTARWGGYSPAGYVPSSAGSAKSGSWSQPSHLSVRRPRSMSSRLGQKVRPEPNAEKLPHTLPTSPASPSDYSVPRKMLPRSSQDKAPHAATYNDETAGQVKHRLESHVAEQEAQQEKQDAPSEESARVADVPKSAADVEMPQADVEVQPRPGTASSNNTYKQVRRLFKDFDGVHYAPSLLSKHHDELEDDELDDDDLDDDRPMLLNELVARQTHIQPPPGDGMVYYPAPVPKQLNMPKRLSRMPPASVQAKRNTQVLESMSDEARKSALWLPQQLLQQGAASASSDHAESNRRRTDSTTNLNRSSGLPPQLRASAFFDHQAVSQDVEVKGESAVDTFNSILEASVKAPVSAFTDHPFAGKVGDEVYGREHGKDAAGKPVLAASPETMDPRKSRSSLNLLFKRKSSYDPLKQHPVEASHSSLRLANLMSSNNEASGPADDVRGDDADQDIAEGVPLNPSNQLEDEHEGAETDQLAAWEHEDQHPDAKQTFGPPTTLLAELQLRKHELRQRTRTAATAFPQGMHATLLELDAVAQVEKKRRVGRRVALAWEDPNVVAAEQADNDDEDVPLGLLFPHRTGLLSKKQDPGQSDWDRPLGLLEKRELEDNEPLSNRRNRLLGVQPGQRASHSREREGGVALPRIRLSGDLDTNVTGDNDADNESDSGEGETLAQRRQRLKSQKAVSGALGDAGARPVSGDFASEMLSQFGASEPKNPGGLGYGLGASTSPAGQSDEEETLAQRRKRLQAEAAARAPRASRASFAQADAARPLLRPRLSMADVLTANPVGGSRRRSDDSNADLFTPGSLLDRREQQDALRRSQMQRQSSFGPDRSNLDFPNYNAGLPSDPRASTMYGGGLMNNSSAMLPMGPMGSVPAAPMGLGLGTPMQGGYFDNAFGMNPHGAGYGMDGPGYGMNPLNYGTNASNFGMNAPNYGMTAPNFGMNAPDNSMNTPDYGYDNAPVPEQVPTGGNRFAAYAYPPPRSNVAPSQGTGDMLPPPAPMMAPRPGVGIDNRLGRGTGWAAPGMNPSQRDMIDRWRQSIF